MNMVCRNRANRFLLSLDLDLTPRGWLVLARDMVTTIDHPVCGPIKMVNTPIKYSFSEPSIRTPPPMLGQHTDEVLRDILELSEDEIGQLRRDGVVS